MLLCQPVLACKMLLSAMQQRGTDDGSAVQDVFSAGCVLAEMFLDGSCCLTGHRYPKLTSHAFPVRYNTELCRRSAIQSGQPDHQGHKQNSCQLQRLHAFKHIGAVAHVEHHGQLLH